MLPTIPGVLCLETVVLDGAACRAGSSIFGRSEKRTDSGAMAAAVQEMIRSLQAAAQPGSTYPMCQQATEGGDVLNVEDRGTAS